MYRKFKNFYRFIAVRVNKRYLAIVTVSLFIFVVIVSAGILVEYGIETDYFSPYVSKPYNWTVQFAENNTVMTVDFDVYNPNPVKIPGSQYSVEGNITFNTITAGHISLRDSYTLKDRDATNITFTMELHDLARCLISHMAHDEKSVLNITLNFTYSLRTKDIDFKEKNLTFTPKPLYIEKDIQTDVLASLDSALAGIVFPCKQLPVIQIESVNSVWEKERVNSKIQARWNRFVPIPHRGVIQGNKITIANVTVDHDYFFFHRPNIEIMVNTSLVQANLESWLESHQGNNFSTNLTCQVYYYNLLGMERTREIALGDISFDPRCSLMGMDFTQPEEEPQEVGNFWEVASLITLLWLFFAIFLVGVYIYFVKKDIFPLPDSASKIVLVYSGWSIVWLSLLWVIEQGVGLSFEILDHVSIALLLVVFLLLKDVIFDVLLEKLGYLPGWKSWYPWFEHLPLMVFLVVLSGPVFSDIPFFVRFLAFIDVIIDGVQDFYSRRERKIRAIPP